ncbi:fibronectin type III-like domain-contianing protein [Sphingomonas sp. SORGH_AS_0879]|uniref:fibronectin type III-like domain-contianing protein n=1 Tax=Sphingomonas sp. SORGH_AS_0879 TaxID=3041790 RepID=UPI00278A8A57|nr:fibronectin type III-like domain-contianing protein [Sphingomonas sp. SORGH_AS_0879]MDQ1231789.1 hypothetical protein [Sphingomonas sp. SORGH_AS_0879]
MAGCRSRWARCEADYPALSLQPDGQGDLPYEDGVLIGYRGLQARGTTPLYAFGAGRGYTRFEWLNVDADGGDVLVTLRNGGDRVGSEVVQLYRHVPEFALVGFAKVVLEPGRTRTVRITPEPRLFRIWNGRDWEKPCQRAGLSVGRASDDLPFTTEVTI